MVSIDALIDERDRLREHFEALLGRVHQAEHEVHEIGKERSGRVLAFGERADELARLRAMNRWQRRHHAQDIRIEEDAIEDIRVATRQADERVATLRQQIRHDDEGRREASIRLGRIAQELTDMSHLASATSTASSLGAQVLTPRDITTGASGAVVR